MNITKFIVFCVILGLSACASGPQLTGWRTDVMEKKSQAALDIDLNACNFEIQKTAYAAPVSSILDANFLAAQINTMRLSCMRSKGWEPVWAEQS